MTPNWKISVRSASKNPQDYILKDGTYVLGRHQENEILIDDESASRKHAQLDCQNEKLILLDLDSTNGTFVNRERINEPLRLKNGDQIRIGFHVVSVSFLHPSMSASTSSEDSLGETQPITRDLLIESVDKNSILLHEFTTQLSTTLDLDLVLQEISEFLRVTIAADKCQVILAEHFERIQEFGFSKSIADQAITKKSLIVIPDTYHIDSISDSAFRYRIRTALCVPVLQNQEIIALVYAYKTDTNARPFDQNDIQLSIAVSHQVVLAIQRSQILEQARGFEQLALTDSLTGLDNRRNFLKLAESEIERARRFEHPLSLMILDIDEFKEINDTYGHLVGDQVLVAVAQRLQSNLRTIDLLARYGGDEFIIFLVEADNKYAAKIGQRLHKSITDNPVDTDRGQLDLSVSIGIAALDRGFTNEVDLFRIADDALYAAKSAGKNQINIVDK